MRAVVQRVQRASVTIDGVETASIGQGYLILLGVGHDDTPATAEKLWHKIAALRIMEDENGKTNRSLGDVGGAVLVVSQFTLYADCRHGRRPSFTAAVTLARADVPQVATGTFAADMKVALVNDGPFTIVLDTDEL